MKEKAEIQLQPITITQIKEVLKKIVPDTFDKMIIGNGNEVKRANYFYTKYKCQFVERKMYKQTFPLHGAIKDNFAEFEGGENVFGTKKTILSENLLQTISKTYKIYSKQINENSISNPFEFPLDETNNSLNNKQQKYFIPNLTYKETCNECNGNKHIKCPDDECNGRHTWTCTDCNGNKTIICNECAGNKKVDCNVCNGTNKVRCKSCGGDGKKVDKFDTISAVASSSRSTRIVQKTCGQCSGKGQKPCTNCSSGKVTCHKCDGQGKLICNNCNGNGSIICNTCHGDKARYGMIDCPQCNTIGTMAHIVYVESIVENKTDEQYILKGNQLKIVETDLKEHSTINPIFEIVYQKVNDFEKINYDEFSNDFTEKFRDKLNLHQNHFPLITEEEIYYEVIPCVELTYKHILTNTEHDFTIINFYNNPKIIFHSEPEQVKQSVNNVSKSVGGFFGKLFKTKSHLTKEDRRIEITLLIYLAKADGKIEEQEKIQLSEFIGHLDDFTNTEKQKLYDLMNVLQLPTLTAKEVKFSNVDRAKEVITKLENLAKADGEFEETEKTFIDSIKQLIGL
jgi:uncharacterized tellurite resistance protein B-like protein